LKIYHIVDLEFYRDINNVIFIYITVACAMSEIINNSPLSKLSVLCVDDDRITRDLLKALLHSFGFRKIFLASSPKEALATLSSTVIDIVLSDWRMPGMSGIEFTKKVRNLPPMLGTNFVNIIMLTGNGSEENVVQARDSGVTEYLIKPFTANDLRKRIIEVVEKPRPFIISDNYKGPSRRRKKSPPPNGIERRKNNPQPKPQPKK
jgi:two-component system chemotaxis response regulator CheY